jgi:hypothetical protein
LGSPFPQVGGIGAIDRHHTGSAALQQLARGPAAAAKADHQDLFICEFKH